MAVTVTAQQLAYRMRLTADVDTALTEPQLTVVTGILAAASALVLKYAATAPDAVHNEAVTRLAGYLYDVPPGSGRAANAMRDSGAMALLSSYHVQRAVPLDDGNRTSSPSLNGLRLYGRATVLLPRASVWTATGLLKPTSAWWVYQIAVGDTVSAASWIPSGALSETATAGDETDISDGYVIGCSTSRELLLAGPQSGVTASLTVWRLEG